MIEWEDVVWNGASLRALGPGDRSRALIGLTKEEPGSWRRVKDAEFA